MGSGQTLQRSDAKWVRAGAVALLVLLPPGSIISSMMVFGLTGIGATALYFLVWWTSLFAVLPFGIESQADRGFVPLGSEPGAPARPALLAKALATTFLATALFVAIGAMLPLAGL